MALLEYFAIRHGIRSDVMIWDMDISRAIQLMFCDSIKNGAVMRYTNAVESESTNQKLEQLERNLKQWQSEQQ